MKQKLTFRFGSRHLFHGRIDGYTIPFITRVMGRNLPAVLLICRHFLFHKNRLEMVNSAETYTGKWSVNACSTGVLRWK